MATYVWVNFFETTLSASVTSGATTINVASASGAPTITSGQQWAITVQSASTPNVREVMYVTAISSTTFTVSRAQEGTAAGTWAIGDYVIGTNTEGQMAAFPQLAATQTWTGTNTFDAVTYLGTSGQFYINPNSGGDQLINFAASNYIQFVPGTGFQIVTGGDIVITAPSGVTVSAGLSAGGNIYTPDNYYGGAVSVSGSVQGATVDSSAGNVTANGGRLRASYGATGSGDSNAATLLGDFTSYPSSIGYQKFPSGIIMQWGVFSTSAWSGIYGPAVSFPVAFPNACWQVLICEGGAGTWNSGVATVYAAPNIYSSYFQPAALLWDGSAWVGPESGGTYNLGFRWMAVGY